RPAERPPVAGRVRGAGPPARHRGALVGLAACSSPTGELFPLEGSGEAAGASASRAPVSQAQEVVSIRRSLMSVPSYLAKLLRGGGRKQAPVRKPMSSRLSLESLEDRTLLSASFAPAVTLPVGQAPGSMVTADLNNDGKQDIVVLNTGLPPDFQNSVSVLLGNGDGTFRRAIT